jgi:hypothetical protein
MTGGDRVLVREFCRLDRYLGGNERNKVRHHQPAMPVRYTGRTIVAEYVHARPPADIHNGHAAS